MDRGLGGDEQPRGLEGSPVGRDPGPGGHASAGDWEGAEGAGGVHRRRGAESRSVLGMCAGKLRRWK